MLQRMRRVLTSVAIAASLIGCASRSTPLPFDGTPVAPAAVGAAVQTGIVYSTPRGIVYPQRLFPSLPGHGLLVPRAVDYFYVMEVAGLTGTSTISGFQGWIPVFGFSLGVGPSNGSHKPATELVITRVVDVTSPSLFSGVVSGKPFMGADPGGGSNKTQFAVLDQNGGKWSEFIWFEFTGPTATSYQAQWTTGLPSETVSIHFSKATLCAVSRPGAAPVCNVWTPTARAE